MHAIPGLDSIARVIAKVKESFDKHGHLDSFVGDYKEKAVGSDGIACETLLTLFI